MKKCALHGFLGKPSDWQFLQGWETPDLFQGESIQQNDLKSWGTWFSPVDLLLGYSMGGRLALHAVLESPSCYRGAVFVSTNPGLRTGREERLAKDREWARKFRELPWRQVMEEWNNNPVFAADRKIVRKETDFDREAIAWSLEKWSSGWQEDLTDQIAELDLPILWIAGELDGSYAEKARRIRLKHPLSKIWIAKGAAHRVPWAVQDQFMEEVTKFQESI